jgi:hypothetical protein
MRVHTAIMVLPLMQSLQRTKASASVLLIIILLPSRGQIYVSIVLQMLFAMVRWHRHTQQLGIGHPMDEFGGSVIPRQHVCVAILNNPISVSLGETH